MKDKTQAAEDTRKWTLSRMSDEEQEMLPGGMEFCEPLWMSNGITSIVLDDGLVIRHNSNSEYPFKVIGAGGASVSINYRQMVHILLEFMRFQAGDCAGKLDWDIKSDTVSFKAEVWVKGKGDDGEE